MPIYEYKCTDCGKKIEAMQKISDEPLTVCPDCAGKLEKQWSLSGFQFKGTGWYVSDYTNRGKENAGKETSSAEGKTGGDGGDAVKTSDGGSDSSKTSGDAAKTVSTTESTTAAPAASNTESKPAKVD